MSTLTRHRAMLGATGTLALAAFGLTACGNSSSGASGPTKTAAAAAATTTPATTTTTATPPSGPSTVDATLSEFKITTSPATAAAGTVTFKVTNSGKVKHQFTIISTDKSAATVLSKHNPNDDIAGARGEISSIQPGQTKTLVLHKLKPGHYALVCALPGHYQSGMHADFTVS